MRLCPSFLKPSLSAIFVWTDFCISGHTSPSLIISLNFNYFCDACSSSENALSHNFISSNHVSKFSPFLILGQFWRFVLFVCLGFVTNLLTSSVSFIWDLILSTKQFVNVAKVSFSLLTQSSGFSALSEFSSSGIIVFLALYLIVLALSALLINCCKSRSLQMCLEWSCFIMCLQCYYSLCSP